MTDDLLQRARGVALVYDEEKVYANDGETFVRVSHNYAPLTAELLRALADEVERLRDLHSKAFKIAADQTVRAETAEAEVERLKGLEPA